jgi:hypothetical protein
MARSESGKGNWVHPTLLVLLVVLFFSRALFTDQIIRASDVITQFFWSAKEISQQGISDYLAGLPRIFQAQWEPLNDGGRTLEGGWNAIGLLFHRYLIQHFFPFPAGIAWLAVLALAWGGLGTYCYCRLVGISRFASFMAGLLFALCTENASLLNAGHIQKMEAIGWMPWTLFFLERGLREKRLFPYAMTALVLAVQFFHMHWQISFYTCLAVGLYWLFMVGGQRREGSALLPALGKQTLLATVMTLLFFSTIAMSFAPLLSWSQQSERGGGMAYEEGMSWSMPPEEVLTYIVPGLFGLSRQEEGDKPAPDEVFYWGRMHFSQTSDYLGLLPWLFLPLPLLFRRDRYSWFFSLFMAVTLLMAMGKYTVFYDLLFRYIPGFSTFRVPKMVLFLFAFGAAVLMAQGMDLFRGGDLNKSQKGRWLAGITATAAILAGGAAFIYFGRSTVLAWVGGMITIATPFQKGPELMAGRYLNMLREAILAFSLLMLYLGILFLGCRRIRPHGLVLMLLLALFLVDLWRVNSRFLVLTDPPSVDRKIAKNDVVAYLESRIGTYRLQPLESRSAFYYADYGLANISAYVTVSEKRYRGFLERFSYMNGMADMMNLRYLVMGKAEYEELKETFAGKFEPVYRSKGGEVVVENRQVLPKAWLVSSVTVMPDTVERLDFMAESPRFRPAEMAVVESPPALPMAPATGGMVPGTAKTELYEPNRIVVQSEAQQNALLVLGEKYYRWWSATVDGRPVTIQPVNHILRGVYLPPGSHRVEFRFDPLPFKVGTWLTLGSLLLMAVIILREFSGRRPRVSR